MKRELMEKIFREGAGWVDDWTGEQWRDFWSIVQKNILEDSAAKNLFKNSLRKLLADDDCPDDVKVLYKKSEKKYKAIVAEKVKNYSQNGRKHLRQNERHSIDVFQFPHIEDQVYWGLRVVITVRRTEVEVEVIFGDYGQIDNFFVNYEGEIQ